jgi:murein DD-endopeptidase MepM/ murein hydrolase activator NlpD
LRQIIKNRQKTFAISAFLVLLIVAFGCKTANVLPSEKFSQYEYTKSLTYDNETLKIELKNPLECPLRIWIFSSDSDLQSKLSEIAPIILEGKSDTVLYFRNIQKFNDELKFSSRLGSLKKNIERIQVDLPFPKNSTYTVLQPNETNFTHNTSWSKYAIDFDLKTNDTICSATDGYVVGIVDKYKFGGIGKEWRDYSNFITIYDPLSGIFCQYVHLVQNGVLVKLGDKIKRGQNIALAGNTGQSTGEHLHFSCLIPVDNKDGLQSIPIEFIGGIKGNKLKKGDKLKN